MSAEKPTVLFLCADNSVRSQLAEALLRHHAGDRFRCLSAGLTAKPVHRLLAAVLREAGVAAEELEAKRLNAFLGHGVRWAIILRTPDETSAPRIFPFATRTMRWEVAAPRCDEATDEEALKAIRRTRDEVAGRLRAWLESLEAPAPHSSAA